MCPPELYTKKTIDGIFDDLGNEYTDDGVSSLHDKDSLFSLTASSDHVSSVHVPTAAGDIEVTKIDPDKIYSTLADDIDVASIFDSYKDIGSTIDIDDEIREAYAHKRGAIRGKALKEEVHEVYKKADMLDEMSEIFKKWYPDEEFTVETFQKLGKMIVQDTVKEICELIGGYGSAGEAEKGLSKKMKTTLKSVKGEVSVVSELLLLRTLIDKYHIDESELPEEGRIKLYRGRDMFNTYESGLLDVLKELKGVK